MQRRALSSRRSQRDVPVVLHLARLVGRHESRTGTHHGLRGEHGPDRGSIEGAKGLQFIYEDHWTAGYLFSDDVPRLVVADDPEFAVEAAAVEQPGASVAM